MPKTLSLIKRTKKEFNSYSISFSRSITPYPEIINEKQKPPTSDYPQKDNSELFKTKPEASLEEQAQAYMDTYRKAERIVVNNFYTGGSAYRKGIIDAIYRGVNPLNPTM